MASSLLFHDSTTEIGGTIPYLPPEILSRPPRKTEKMDIWALGCVLFEAASGRLFFEVIRSGELNEVFHKMEPSIAEVVKLMVHPDLDKRVTATKLKKTDLVEGWKCLLDEKSPLRNAKPTQSHFLLPFVTALGDKASSDVTQSALRYLLRWTSDGLNKTLIDQGAVPRLFDRFASAMSSAKFVSSLMNNPSPMVQLLAKVGLGAFAAIPANAASLLISFLNPEFHSSARALRAVYGCDGLRVVIDICSSSTGQTSAPCWNLLNAMARNRAMNTFLREAGLMQMLRYVFEEASEDMREVVIGVFETLCYYSLSADAGFLNIYLTYSAILTLHRCIYHQPLSPLTESIATDS